MRACQKMRWNFARSAPSRTAASSSACELTTYARARSGAIATRARSSASGACQASTIASFPHGLTTSGPSSARAVQ